MADKIDVKLLLELNIIAFEAEDVITTSLTDGGEGTGDEGDFGELFG